MPNTNFSIAERVLIRSRQIRFKSKINAPYLSGDGFASLADFRVESKEDLEEYSKLQKIPRIVYARSDLVTQVLSVKKVGTEEHVLLAGNGDVNFQSINIFSHSIFSRFYLQNSFISNNKDIFTLPIGVENLAKGINGLPSNLRNNRSWPEKKRNVMIGPFSPTHAERFNRAGHGVGGIHAAAGARSGNRAGFDGVQFFVADLASGVLADGFEHGDDVEVFAHVRRVGGRSGSREATGENRSAINEHGGAIHAGDADHRAGHVLVATTDGHIPVHAAAADDRFDGVRDDFARD